MRCEIPHRCVRRKYRIRRHSPFRLRNCWEGRSVRASSLLRQLAKGGCAARRLSWVTPGFSQSRRCKTTASEFRDGSRDSDGDDEQSFRKEGERAAVRSCGHVVGIYTPFPCASHVSERNGKKFPVTTSRRKATVRGVGHFHEIS